MKNLSILIPVFNSARTIESLCRALIENFKDVKLLQIILVNDGSQDDSDQKCRSLYKHYPEVITYVQLTQNYGEHNALLAGLHHNRGDFCVLMDDDFQNPPEEIQKLIDKIEQGYDVVYSWYDKKNDSFIRNLGSLLNDKLANVILNKPPQLYLSSFKIIRRNIIRRMTQCKDPWPYIDALILNSNVRIGQVKVCHDQRRSSQSGYTLRKLLTAGALRGVINKYLPTRKQLPSFSVKEILNSNKRKFMQFNTTEEEIIHIKEALRKDSESDDDYQIDLLVSRMINYSLYEDASVKGWLDQQRMQTQLHSSIIPLSQMDKWQIQDTTGDITHESGRFFTITGLSIRHQLYKEESIWDQPIIDQPEVGILGLLVKSINGVLHFCIQAKEEPGNINAVQLAPSFQATFSNYSKVHGGKAPHFIDYFLKPDKNKILYSNLQTEDGGRFLAKFNRNMIVMAGDELTDLPPNFIWLTLRQIRALIEQDNCVNSCMRSLLACFCNGRSILKINDNQGGSLHTLDELKWWLKDSKDKNKLQVDRIGLNELKDWQYDDENYSQKNKKYFHVCGLRVQSLSREVQFWDQPIVKSVAPGIIGLLIKEMKGLPHVLMQAKAEPGYRNIIQIAPTVLFTPQNYDDQKPFLYNVFMADHSKLNTTLRDPFTTYWSNMQSEEGGRFYKEEHKHVILKLNKKSQLKLPPSFRWMSIQQIRYYLKQGNYVNSCARSILACMI